jgi:hypothetical protein
MEQLFRDYWWLMFPLFWFIAGAWHSLVNLRRHRDNLDLIKSYVASGKEIPPSLLESINKPSLDDDWDSETPRARRGRRYYRRGFGGWPNVALFGSLALGFGYAAWIDIYGQGQAFTIVALIMGSMFLASLVATLVARSMKD